jgi:Cu/Ag efflux protein CusF
MKVVFFTAAAALVIQAGPALGQSGAAQDPHAGHHVAAGAQTRSRPHRASAVVKKIDAAKGSVTLANGPVPELKWPAMTMVFSVKDKALMDKLALDKKVDFEFVEQGSGYVVTAVK